jgi:hypothetical protein
MKRPYSNIFRKIGMIALTAAVTQGTFTPFTSATLDAIVGDPDGVSKLCLSCHDGVTAVDSFAGTTGTIFVGDGAGEHGDTA